MNEYLEAIKSIDVTTNNQFIVVMVIFMVLACFVISESNNFFILGLVAVFLGSIFLICFSKFNYEKQININKKIIIADNLGNKLLNIDEGIVNKHHVKIYSLKDTIYIYNAPESKLVVEEVTYNIKPGRMKWMYDAKAIEEINNTKKYFLKEVYQK